MDKKISVSAMLKTKFIKPINEARFTWLETLSKIKIDIEDYESILSTLKAGLITFKSNGEVNIKNTNENEKNNITTQLSEHDRGLKQTMKLDGFNEISKRINEMPDIDSSSSISPTLNRKFATQLANHILEPDHNFIETTTLRPTDYSEEMCANNNTISSPPVKSRRTSRKKSAVHSHEENESSNVNYNIDEINYENVQNQNFTNNCKLSIALNRLEAQEIDKLLIGENRKTLKRNRGVCFGRYSHLNTNDKNATRGKSLQIIKTWTPSDNLSHMHNIDYQGNESRNKVNTDRAIRSIEEAAPKLELGDVETAHRFKRVRWSCSSIPQHKVDCYLNKEQNTLKLDDNFVKQKGGNEYAKVAIVNISEKGTVQIEPVNNNDVITMEPRNDNLRVNENQTNIEQDDYIDNNTIDNSQDDSRSIRSRTKVIKNEVAQLKESELVVDNECICDKNVIDVPNEIQNINWGSRTKTIRKHSTNENNEDKENHILKEKLSNCLLLKSKEETEIINKYDKKLILNPTHVSGKGDHIKKQMAHNKKNNCEVDQLAEKRITRTTKNGAKNKNRLLTTGINHTKDSFTSFTCVKTTSISKLPTPENVCRTPLANYNRTTPGTNPASKTRFGLKKLNSITHKNQVENITAINVKRNLTEAKNEIREEQKFKHIVNDEIAKKKKEKALRATSIEARRKREEKLQKVADAREAAEKEKALLAEKLKKEKEGKIRVILTKKYKQKEDLKKKLIKHKQIEHEEERKKNEEADCLVKLKTLEEEHNRVIANKEREREVSFKQHQAAKEISDRKLSGFGSKLKEMKKGTATPENSMIIQPEVQSYDITPACDKTQLLKPKTENDYGIDDVLAEDPSDDESHPKKILPLWAQSQNRDYLLSVNNFLPKRIWALFMEADHCIDIKKTFGCKPIRKRTSSAIWGPPLNDLQFTTK